MDPNKEQIGPPIVTRQDLSGWRNKIDFVIVNKILPVGVFVFLTGMLWVGEHGRFPPLYHMLVALPSLLLLIVHPILLAHVLKSRIVAAYVLFAIYMSLSLFWSATEENALDMLKRPLLVLLLFVAFFELGQRRADLLRLIIKWSAICAVVAALITLARFEFAGGHGRLAGYGALYNPLLVSHVFGFFTALWLGILFTERKLFDPLSFFAILICGILLFATGSRTPLLAMVVTIVWLAALTANRKAALIVGALTAFGTAITFFAPVLITQRGLSYRTEIWANALQQIGENVWFGHGYEAPLWIQLNGFAYPFSEPHNLTLSVLYAGGIFGLLLWLGIYVVALEHSWRLRSDRWVLMCSATVVYGLAAGMTEGGSFLSRPKEHWYLIWIPLALLAATTYRDYDVGKTK